MAERSTVTTETKGGHTAKIREYMTNAERRLCATIQTREQGKESATNEMRLKAIFDAEDKALEILIAELDGSSDNIVQRLNELPTLDYDGIIAVVTEVKDGKKK